MAKISVWRADAPKEQIITHPQLIAIEILSPEDRLSRFQNKIDDYLAFGIEHI
jgi:Uma2 family endonuclease